MIEINLDLMEEFIEYFDYLFELHHYLDVIHEDYTFFEGMSVDEIDEFREFFKNNFHKTELNTETRYIRKLKDRD